MKKLSGVFTFLAIFAFGLAPRAEALSYNVEFVGALYDEATTQSMGDEKDWFQWMYKVSITEGDDTNNGLSHSTFELLQECYDTNFLVEIGSTAGANGVPTNPGNLFGLQANEYREYAYPVEVGLDPTTGLYGLKWNIAQETDNFEDVGDYDYYWFSVPTAEQFDGQAAIKVGRNQFYYGIPIPDCPECSVVVTPEPATLVLFGAGAVGLVARRRRKK